MAMARTSIRTLQNQGVQQTVSGEIFGQRGSVGAGLSPILDFGSGASRRFKREELLKGCN